MSVLANDIMIAEASTVPSHHGRAYAELEGGQGREVFFRPRRYPREDLGPVCPVVRVVLGPRLPSSPDARATVHECALRDVSQSGVAVEWPTAARVETGTVVPSITVSFDGYEAYSGRGRVDSVREVDQKVLVGVSFTDGLLNIRDVMDLREVRSWNLSGAGPLRIVERPWQVDGCDRFKGLLGELRLLLEDAFRMLARVESSLPWGVVHGERESPARRALIENIHEEFAVEFAWYSAKVNDAFRAASEHDVESLKEYSRRQIHEYLMQAPCLHRALHKPLGYPGDYELMRQFYDMPFAGPTLFAKAMNLAILRSRGVHAVRSRKDTVKERLRALLDARPGEAPVRVLSIAAGPAQEIFELLCEREPLPRPLEVVLFDQDEGALSHAHARLTGLVGSRWNERVRVVYLRDSIKSLLKGRKTFDPFGRFDVIFCSGLFHYLAFRTAVALARSLVENLEAEGTLYIGNMVPENPNRWLMELHLDWVLLYRSRAELLRVARAAWPAARVEIVEEATGLNPFVSLRRE
ncbi:MAG TPA: hypothetical protein VEK07_14610 [Polyangiaceae bacterium]|nr:hypothetical protein [Polyangiaceae bacterium]